jgi:hypothetical protein
LKNAILVHGKPNSGRHTALRLTAEELARVDLLPTDQIQTMDLALYPGQGEEKLFLQDLYAALKKGGILVLDHYESCHPAFLQQLAELICTGKLNLASRYVMQKGHLVDAGTALASETVGSLEANGCYIVIVSEKGQDKLAGAFGAKVVDALGDVCCTDALSRQHLEQIAGIHYEKLQNKAAKQLGFTLIADAGIDVDMISQFPLSGANSGFSFTVSDNDFVPVLSIASEVRNRSPKTKISVSSGNCKITVSGEEMRGTPGVSATVFKAVSSVDADVRMITTSEIEIAMLVVKSDVDAVIEAIKKEFAE